jgi:hypothetical protein
MMRVNIARETGWTFDYIDSLNMADVGDYISVLDATEKAKAKIRKQKGIGSKGKRGRT